MILKQNFTEINGRLAFSAEELERQGYNPATHPAFIETVQAEEAQKDAKRAEIAQARREAGYDAKYGNTGLGDAPLSDEQVLDAIRLAAARVDNKSQIVMTPEEIADRQDTNA